MGTLNIEAGGHVSSMNAYVGGERGSEGTVSVTGSGSKWTNFVRLEVGSRSRGTVNIRNGGEVSTEVADLYIATVKIETEGQFSTRIAYVGASDPNQRATVSVSGSGSKWTISEDCLIGLVGPGTLNVLDRAAVSVGNLLAFRWTGNLKLDGGTLDALTIYNAAGGRADFLAGTLRFGTFEGNLTNAGATVRSRDGVFGMRVNGNYTQGADAKLLIEIAGLPDSFLFDLFDVLTVTGAANLAGTLALDFSAFVPPEPTTYKFLNARTITGTFDSFEVIGLDPSLVSFNIPAGEFTVVPEPTTLALLLAAGVCLLPYARRKRN